MNAPPPPPEIPLFDPFSDLGTGTKEIQSYELGSEPPPMPPPFDPFGYLDTPSGSVQLPPVEVGPGPPPAPPPYEPESWESEAGLGDLDQLIEQIPDEDSLTTMDRATRFTKGVGERVSGDAYNTLTMTPGMIAGQSIANSLTPKLPPTTIIPSVTQTISRAVPQVAAAMAVGNALAPEVNAMITGQGSGYDPSKHAIPVEFLPGVDVGRIPYHFNKAVRDNVVTPIVELFK